MYVCMVTHIARVWINPGKVANPARGHLNRKHEYFIFPCPHSRLRIWSRETDSAVPSRISLLISVIRLNLVLTYEIPPVFHGGFHVFVYLNRHTPSGQSRVYRVTRIKCVPMAFTARLRRHRARKPQGSSKRVLPWQVTMDQLICASLYVISIQYTNLGNGFSLAECYTCSWFVGDPSIIDTRYTQAFPAWSLAELF